MGPTNRIALAPLPSKDLFEFFYDYDDDLKLIVILMATKMRMVWGRPPQCHLHRVAKCQGFWGLIRVKMFAGWGKKFGRKCTFAKLSLF